MEIVDFIIFGLILVSFTINLLAIGAFRVTPGLRRKSNRFVVNLLIINLVGCCILAPTLILIGNQNTVDSNVYSLEIMRRKNTTSDHLRLSTYTEMMIQNSKDMQIESGNENAIAQCDENKYTDMMIDPSDEQSILESTQLMRLWSIDLAAALGVLSVLLVVGDTWMAVRDPLHYHKRISRVKAWVLITMTWTLGIFFGMISAYRQINFECITVIEKKRNVLSEEIEELTLTMSTIFNMIFACIYFIVIILLPFGFVCGMYWRIFSEAKGNGAQKFNNRSSPLLLSMNNLTHNHHRQEQTILLRKKNLFNDNNRNHEETFIPPSKEPSSFPSSREEINQLPIKPLLVRSSDRLYAIRQIYSTPNFQKFNQGYSNFLTGFEPTSNLRYMAQQALQIPTTHNYMISVFKHREESRAARISILVVIMFLVSYLPYGFLVLLQGSQVIENFPYSTQLAVFMIILANISSPFIFAYRNKRVRHGVSRFLGLDIRSRDSRQRDECVMLRRFGFIRNRSKLYAYSKSSCKYLKPIFNNSSNRLIRTNNNGSTVGAYTYLTNSASPQSSIIFGHMAIVNKTIDNGLGYPK